MSGDQGVTVEPHPTLPERWVVSRGMKVVGAVVKDGQRYHAICGPHYELHDSLQAAVDSVSRRAPPHQPD